MGPRKRLAVLATVLAVTLGVAMFAPIASAAPGRGGAPGRVSLWELWWGDGGAGPSPDALPPAGVAGPPADDAAGPVEPSDIGPSDIGPARPDSPASSSAPAAPVAPPAAAGAGARCARVTVIAARGTGEAAGTGFLLGQVARQIDGRLSTPTTIVGLNYPASSDFAGSSRAGVTELNRLVAAAGPGTCLVLLGYSQGAIVVGDALAGLNAGNGAKVRAAVMFGDPRFNSAEPYNVGSFARNSRGLNPRRTGELRRFNDRIRNFCNGGDVVCQGSGANGSGSHLDYNQFAGQAAGFAAAKA